MVDAKESSGHRNFEVVRELKAAITEQDVERVHNILDWGREVLGHDAHKELGQLLDDPDLGALQQAACAGNSKMISLFLDCGANPNLQDEDGRTALHAATRAGSESAVWALLNKGQADHSITDKEGHPPLMEGLLLLWTHQDDEEAARTVSLLAQFAGPEKLAVMKAQFRRVLASKFMNSRVLVSYAGDGDVKRLTEEIHARFMDPNSVDGDGVSALEMALKNQQHAAVSCLLEAGAKVDTTRCYKSMLEMLPRIQYIEGAGDGDMKYGDVCEGADGRLYASPQNASNVLVIDPASQELSFQELGLPEKKMLYSGMCAAANGRMYCAPNTAQHVLVIDPKTKALSFLDLPQLGSEGHIWGG